MITRKLLTGAIPAMLGASLGCSAANVAQPSRPNIVLILADDLGYSDIGCFGGEIETPNLDRLARDGLRMTQFYTTPRCCPTRASLLTGLYSHQAGIGNMMDDRGVPGYRGELSKNALTIAEELRLAGYRTSAVGKWHVAHIYFDGKKQLNREVETPFWDNKNTWPLQRGFENYYGTIHGVNSYYDPFSLTEGNTPILTPQPRDYYYTDAISARAVAEIDRHAKVDAGERNPFFLYVAYTAPHWPLQAREADIAKYRKRYLDGWDKLRSARYQRQIDMGIIDKNYPLSPRDERVSAWDNVRDKEWEANRMATYAAMVENMDTGIGRICIRLKQLGLDENTLVIFLSDNGACDERIHPSWYDVPSRTRDGRPVRIGNNDRSVFAGPEDVWQSYGIPWANVSDTPFRLYKHFTHEGGIATPLIARWPAGIQKPGTISTHTGHIIDIMATLVDAAGAKHPAAYEGRDIKPLEGASLLPIFANATGDVERATPLFWEHEGNRAVRLGKWKLVAQNQKPWELYDIADDRTEQKNLAAANPQKVKELADLYDAWAERCGVLARGKLPPARPIKPAAN
ncbi:arylsulfatase [Termitidicoccus mucosus]|uniref:Arylsulfatase n=1 Tax=Termitidicoccus mucosus TaxID=1184151 RepID=A0A178INW3_9BACT|nr:arylsulfatase [Opitutaceae bacterium TSB47]